MYNAQLLNEKSFANGEIQNKHLQTLIKNEEHSPQKLKMKDGERYYVGEHDILQKDFTACKISETDKDEQEKIEIFKNPNRSNHHNINAFHKILVDQKTAYCIGKEPTISVEGAENNAQLKAYEGVLADFAEDTFNEVMQDFVTGVSNKGQEFLHIYYNKAGDLQYCVVSAAECIPIFSEESPQELEQLIRYYYKKEIQNGEYYIKKKVEHWTKTDVTYYEERDGSLFLTSNCPHWFDTFSINGTLTRRQPHAWRKVPFILLKNNAKATTD